MIEHTHQNPGDPNIKILGKGQKWRDVGLGVQTLKTVQSQQARKGKSIIDEIGVK